MALPATALGTQTPLTIRPSHDDVFTSQALVESLYEAGVPQDSIYFLPGDKEVSEKVMAHSDQAIAFGGEQLQQTYQGAEGIEVFGPGESAIYIDEEFTDSEEVYDVVEEALTRDGGRGCINASRVLTNGDSTEVAQRIAERVSDYEVRDILNPEADIPAFKDGESAEQINQLIDSKTRSEQVNNSADERLVHHEGGTYLRPTVVEVESYNSEIATELPFQYMTVAEIDEEEFDDAVAGSLSLALFTEDEELKEKALYHPEVDKVYADGAATCDFRLTEPHEGYITDTVLQKKAYRE
jgi:acyl-CoA reductase-like NAD-dependent aldehyde dehydrogenase